MTMLQRGVAARRGMIVVALGVLVVVVGPVVAGSAAAFASAVDNPGDSIVVAQLLGSSAREKRADRRDSRQDCRVDEGAVGQDKRECKDERRDQRDDAEAFRAECEKAGGEYGEMQVNCDVRCEIQYQCRYSKGLVRICDASWNCSNTQQTPGYGYGQSSREACLGSASQKCSSECSRYSGQAQTNCIGSCMAKMCP